MNLENTDLRGAALQDAELDRAILRNAHLDKTNLDRTHLEGANLRRAHLEGAFLIGTHLEGADLRSACLDGANLRDAHLGSIARGLPGADLRGASGLTVQQLGTVNTLRGLYGVQLDSPLRDAIKQRYPHLLAEPKW